jgi:hypothetical protein
VQGGVLLNTHEQPSAINSDEITPKGTAVPRAAQLKQLRRPAADCVLEQKGRDYLLWGCFRSSFASSSSRTPATCWLLVAYFN